MAKAVTQSNLVVVTELVVKPGRGQIEAVVIREEAAIGFKLVDQELANGRSRINSQNIRENSCASSRRQCGLPRKAWDRSCSQASKSTEDRCLVISCGRTLGPENTGVGQQRNGILGVTHKTFKGAIEKGLIFFNWHADRAAELLAREGIFGMRALHVWRSRIESGSRRKRLANGEWIGSVQRVIAEVAKQCPVNIVAARFGYDIDGCSGSPAQVCTVVRAVNL